MKENKLRFVIFSLSDILIRLQQHNMCVWKREKENKVGREAESDRDQQTKKKNLIPPAPDQGFLSMMS